MPSRRPAPARLSSVKFFSRCFPWLKCQLNPAEDSLLVVRGHFALRLAPVFEIGVDVIYAGLDVSVQVPVQPHGPFANFTGGIARRKIGRAVVIAIAERGVVDLQSAHARGDLPRAPTAAI